MKLLCSILALGLLALAPPVQAERCRQITVSADEKLAGNTLSLVLVHKDRNFVADSADDAPRLSAGSPVDLCFESSADGYVSLWSHDAAGGTPVRILPNEYINAADDEPGIAVRAGNRQCFSDLMEGRDVSLRVQPPYGGAEVYLHYSASRDGQIAPGDFPSIGNKSFEPGPSCDRAQARTMARGPDTPYASTSLRYEVVE